MPLDHHRGRAGGSQAWEPAQQQLMKRWFADMDGGVTPDCVEHHVVGDLLGPHNPNVGSVVRGCVVAAETQCSLVNIKRPDRCRRRTFGQCDRNWPDTTAEIEQMSQRRRRGSAQQQHACAEV